MKYYLDEDISPKVAELLRKNNIDAISAHENNMLGASDEEQLLAATADYRVMVTRNRNDFIALTVRFFESIQPHHGLIIIPYSIPGSKFSLLAKLLTEFPKKHTGEMEPYTIEFLGIEISP